VSGAASTSRVVTANTDLDILYLDNHLLVVNKPAGLLVQEDETGDLDLLTIGKAYLRERFHKPGRVFLGLVHRLDRPASGVMVLARTSKAAARLSEQFRVREPGKRYLALVEGTLSGEGTREDFLVKVDRTVRVVSPSHSGAKKAVLHWRSLATDRMKTGDISLVDVELVTGRAHQIRVQLSTMGFPILGDMRYGATRELDGRNLALHSYALTIEHPTLREEMTFRALPPTSWAGYFESLIHDVVKPND
jgi:23S rRNA pseudouridine1911/1915/1917 synthase